MVAVFQEKTNEHFVTCCRRTFICHGGSFLQNESGIFFEDAKKLYDEESFHDFRMLIYNCDETGLSSVPNSTSKVLARREEKSVQRLCVGERGTLTTLLMCMNADGDSLPPFIIFKGSCPSDDRSGIPGISSNSSKSGYIDKNVFLLFWGHFQQHRKKIP